MSPRKRTERAAAKQRAGRGRHPAQPQQARPAAEIPTELRPSDYPFPTIELPQVRAIVSTEQLLAALDDEPTEPLAGVVVDGAPQPAQHEGLAPAAAPSIPPTPVPIPVPMNPFLNAHPPKHAAAPSLALPARLTGAELAILGRPVPADAPALPVEPSAPQLYQPILRGPRHELVFSSFDAAFWRECNAESARLTARVNQAAQETLRTAAAMDARLARVEAAHQLLISRVATEVYRGELTDAVKPMPLRRRTPGAALVAIAADRRQWVLR